MSLYSNFSAQREGEDLLAAARLRYRILTVLHQALTESGITKAELARRLGVRRSAVGNVFRGDGNLRVNTIAEYLSAMDRELAIDAVERGTARREIETSADAMVVSIPDIVGRGGHKPGSDDAYRRAGRPVQVA